MCNIKKKFLKFLFILTFNLLFIVRVFSFTLMNASEPRFSNPAITVDFSSNNCANSTASPTVLRDLAMKAVELYWNSIPTCKLDLKRGQIVNVDLSSAGVSFSSVIDNHILIGCNADTGTFTSGSILAVGAISGNKGIVLINDIATNVFDQISESQKMATVAHEIGHAIGIGHSESEYALMYYSIGLIQERLSYDDMDACQYLYNDDKIVNCGSVVNINNNPDDKAQINNLLLLLITFLLIITIGKFHSSKLG